MDHWGDPWSDNADDKSPTKVEVISPIPPAQPAGPVLLNGFLDDAGWGNEDDGFGDWATSSSNDAAVATVLDSVPPGTSALADESGTQDKARWDLPESNIPPISTHGDGGNNWNIASQDKAGLDTVSSEASDSATTVQLDDVLAEDATDSSGHLQPDDDSSARPSTSPSERSHNEVAADSPRTSIEEERGVIKHVTSDANLDEKRVLDASENKTVEGGLEELEGRDSHVESDGHVGIPSVTALERDVPISDTPSAEAVEAVVPETKRRHAFGLDTLLLDELFTPLQVAEELQKAHEDPVYSTSARKAWYRLTRKQTMREFNGGTGDDNYIRVTWATSNVRTEVNKIVGRWAREDRLSGTGPGARASFYWDTPAPVQPQKQTKHLRTKTSVLMPRVAAPARQSLPPLATDAPAAFSWNSPIVPVDTWQHLDPLPVIQDHAVSDKGQIEEERSFSTSDVLQRSEPHVPEEAPNAARETLSVAGLISSPTSSATPALTDLWANVSSVNTDIPAKHVSESTTLDDDDEWGEMVGSPTVSTPNTPQTTSQNTFPSEAIPVLPSTPPMIKPSSVQAQSADAMHASHIVRLRGAISPTSAIFGGRSFVPLGVERGPIGPGILKPVQRSVSAAFEQSKDSSALPSLSETLVMKKPQREVATLSESPFFETRARAKSPEVVIAAAEESMVPTVVDSISPPQPARPSTPPAPSITTQPEATTDPWADADFSFFESAIPTTAPVPPEPKPSSSDTFSAFVTPPRSTRAASKSFSRSPPRTTTSPPVQPLTNATNAAQRRKDEEEQIIRNILGGLPDLGYMLR